MDPFSLTAGIITVLGAVNGVGRTVKTLTSFRGAPAIVLALNNEVSELQLIVKELEIEFHKHNKSIQPAIDRNLTKILTDANQKLLEVDGLLDSKVIKDRLHGKLVVRRSAWLRHLKMIQKCHEELRCIRHELFTALRLLNS